MRDGLPRRYCCCCWLVVVVVVVVVILLFLSMDSLLFMISIVFGFELTTFDVGIGMYVDWRVTLVAFCQSVLTYR